jgi:hypothetical protein
MAKLKQIWHHWLCLVGIRNDVDWAPPALGPEVNHPYMAHALLQCCEHCGGGRLHGIHKPPYDARRLAEVLGARSVVAAAERIELERRLIDYEGH